MTATTEAFQQLLTGQMEAFASYLANQYPQMDRDLVMAKAREHCDGMNLVEAVNKLPKKARTKRATRTATPADPSCRCMARVWQSGSGLDQCTRTRLDGADYCKSHAKKAVQGELACQVAPEGKSLANVPAKLRIGLWCGRVDEWQDGEEGIPPYKDSDGIIRIEWSSETMKARLVEELEEGTARHAGERRPRSRKTNTPTTVEASVVAEVTTAVEDDTSAAMMDALDQGPEVVGESAKEPEVVAEEPAKEPEVVAEEPAKEPEVVAQPVVEVETEAVADVYDADTDVEDGTDELTAMLADPTDAQEAPGDDDEMEVEEREHEGETYYVDGATGDIYDIESGETIGKWEGDEATGKPLLN